MKRFSVKKIAVFLLAFAVMPVAFADLLGVEDAAMLANAVKQLEQLQDQYKLMNKAYETSKLQSQSLDAIKAVNDDIKKSNTGSYGFGGMNNGAPDLEKRQWSANNWRDALKNISGGNPTRYKELVSDYEKAHPTLMKSPQELGKGTSSSHLSQYQQHLALNKAASVETTYAFNEVNEHLKSIHDLSSHIDKATNTKGAIDLNSRLLAEIAYIEVMNLKLQTLISQQLAQASANELADDAEMIRFNTLPEE